MVHCPRLKRKLCLMPRPYTPLHAFIYLGPICISDESSFLDSHKTSFCQKTCEWYNFVSPSLQDGFFHHVPNFRLMPISYGCWFPLFIAAESINSCLGICLRLEMKRREPPEDINRSCRSRSSGICYTDRLASATYSVWSC